ncbi:D-xylose reductase [Coemansia interrupta]|uniref:D-xylose reductase n=1 Tax=Coemansia interrupta TaxID=1126814 RepID=A0A9W8H4G5_9FUNG|nr:D-xylose reductase [Coemansia interrupta]
MPSSSIKLNSGHAMPIVGMGLWKVPRAAAAAQVYQAIKHGYRLLDCASDYGNEKEVGQGIHQALADRLVTRDELFVTSKLWCTYHHPDHVLPALRRTLADLQLTYIDLYLVHFPIALQYVPFDERYPAGWTANGEPDGPLEYACVSYQDTWQAMERLADQGLARSIGISNTPGALVYDILSYARVRPAVLQIELHPYLHRGQLVDLAHAEGLAVTAFSSFGDTSYREINMVQGEVVPLLKHGVVEEIARKAGRTPAQVLLRWAVQRGCAVIPKSSNVGRMLENLDVLGWQIADEDMQSLAALDRNLMFNDPATYAKRAIWAS